MEGAAIHNWVIIIYNMRIIVCRWMDIVALPILPRKQHSLQYFFFRVKWDLRFPHHHWSSSTRSGWLSSPRSSDFSREAAERQNVNAGSISTISHGNLSDNVSWRFKKLKSLNSKRLNASLWFFLKIIIVAFSGETHREEGHCKWNSINIQMSETFAHLPQFRHTFSLMDIIIIIIIIVIIVIMFQI